MFNRQCFKWIFIFNTRICYKTQNFLVDWKISLVRIEFVAWLQASTNVVNPCERGSWTKNSYFTRIVHNDVKVNFPLWIWSTSSGKTIMQKRTSDIYLHGCRLLVKPEEELLNIFQGCIPELETQLEVSLQLIIRNIFVKLFWMPFEVSELTNMF